MFSGINDVFNSVIVERESNGWYHLDMRYFDNHPEILRTVATRIDSAPLAHDVIRRRYRTLNKDSRPIGQCPRRGVAVRRRETKFLYDWMQYLAKKYNEHYGDTIGVDCGIDATGEFINHFACGKHEEFQLRKMGLFAPYKYGSLTNSVHEFVELGRANNARSLDNVDLDVVLQVFDEVAEEDLGGIKDGSLSVVPPEVAVYESNVQGLATGFIQLARDLTFDSDRAKELSRLYGFDFKPGERCAEALIRYYSTCKFDFTLADNIVTNLKRVQVGGLDIDLDTLLTEGLSSKNIKNAKYRTINTNDPIVQIAEASASIPFREAIKYETNGIFYNTLFDPDGRWERIKESILKSNQLGVTQFPFDFEKHDAQQHAEWMFNLIQRVVKRKFRREDWEIIDLVSLCLVFKILLAPNGKGGSYSLVWLIGALGSGDPWTNIYGTLGTRSVARLLAKVRPDIFYCSPEVGFNNGDDTSIGVYKRAIDELGIEEIVNIANDIVNSVHYFFNNSKLISVCLPDRNYITHWEQYAYWYNVQTQEVMRHGSTLRYFGKVYVAEDAGRETPLEGIMDQLSTLNNTIGYVGNQTFSTTTLNIEVLIDFIKNDNVLMSYMNKYGKAFFEHITDDAIVSLVDKLKKQREAEGANGRYFGATDEQLVDAAKAKITKHLHISGYDKDQVTRVIHDKDFSFFGIAKLMGLGVAELSRIATVGKGRMILFSINDGKVSWKAA